MREIHDPWSGGAIPFRVVRDQAANGKKGVRQFYLIDPPRPDYDGNDCVCHVMDREFKKTLEKGALGELLAFEHRVAVYFKKSSTAGKILNDCQREKLEVNANYFSERAQSLGWNQAGAWLQLPISNKPLRPILSMPVRWWSGVDENVRFSLQVECYEEAIPRVQRELRRKSKHAKAEALDCEERDLAHLVRLPPYLYPIKLAIKELEGPFIYYYTYFSAGLTRKKLGEKYPTYPKIVKWVAVLREHFREAIRFERALPNFSERIVSALKELAECVERISEKLNEDAFIAALLHIGIRDTFFPDQESTDRYWTRLEQLYKCDSLF